MTSLRYPNINGLTEREQLAQVNSYLRQMVDQLNFALQSQGGTGQAGADGKDGKNGVDGKDGKDGADGKDGKDGADGKDGKDGADGKTPQKGVDYWTDEDVKQIVDAAVEDVLKEKVKILEASMPVGYLYASNSPTDPKTLFGFGTWERIEDCFPLAAGSTYAAGTTGGEATHTLTVDEMPSHSHYYHTAYGTPASGATENGKIQTAGYGNTWVWNQTGSIVESGGGAAHNNMPPYYAMYMWIRTA